MAQTTVQYQYLGGIVMAVPTGDTLVIMQNAKPGAKEHKITLSSITAPKLGNKYIPDAPLAWNSREYLRKLCVGKYVDFRIEYTYDGQEFGTVLLGNKNLAELVVSEGLATVKPNQNDGKASPFLDTLKRAIDQAKKRQLGIWTMKPGDLKRAIRDLPPSTMGNASGFDAIDFVDAFKGKPMDAIVEQVRDGTTIRMYLLPEFEYVQVYIAGIQAPPMRKNFETKSFVDTSSMSSAEGSPDRLAMEAKHFSEMRVLNRDVRVVFQGVDKYNNLIGSVYYTDGESSKDLAMELVENGLAKYVKWSASFMEESTRTRIKSTELKAKKNQLKMWKNFVVKDTILDKKFTGKVIEVGNADWIVVSDDAVPMSERRVYLSSIICPKLGNPRKNETPENYAYEARALLRKCLIGQQVNVSIEYPQTISYGEEPDITTRVVNCGSVFLENNGSLTKRTTYNVAEMLVARGYASVIKHEASDARSDHYADLLAAEARAVKGKKGMHSKKEYVVKKITDRTEGSEKDATAFLASLQKKKINAIVEYIFSGHRFKLYIPEESSYIPLSLSSITCPGRNQPYSKEAIAFIKKRILNRDVEIEIETVDKRGNFLGSLWISGNNIAISLVQAGLANVFAYDVEKITDGHLLKLVEQTAKRNKLKIWENFTEGELTNGPLNLNRRRTKIEMKVKVTDILDGGRFYVQVIGEDKASIEQRLSSLNLGKPSKIDNSFNPKNGDIVLSRFHADNRWYRVMVVKIDTSNDNYEVFYIDYGNQEIVSVNDLRPLNHSIPTGPGLAKLCKLAYVKVPNLYEEYGKEAAFWLNEETLDDRKKFRAIVERTDNSFGAKAMGRGTGPVLEVTLIEDIEPYESVNAYMLEVGLARLNRNRGPRSKEMREAMKTLEPYQDDARNNRLGMWAYGDIPSDDDDKVWPVKRAGTK